MLGWSPASIYHQFMFNNSIKYTMLEAYQDSRWPAYIVYILLWVFKLENINILQRFIMSCILVSTKIKALSTHLSLKPCQRNIWTIWLITCVRSVRGNAAMSTSITAALLIIGAVIVIGAIFSTPFWAGSWAVPARAHSWLGCRKMRKITYRWINCGNLDYVECFTQTTHLEVEL